uniref:Conserved oligomeric Golgi complex subunit 8 n=1 Tax=Steinernema glaseri TaxID=37863 RepID=A0A1I8AD69_9BILA
MQVIMLGSRSHPASKTIEDDLKVLSVGRLRTERSGLSSHILHLQNEIGDLAFNNYRTYADVGRTAELCKEMFSDMSETMSELKDEVPDLVQNIKQFYSESKKGAAELSTLQKATSSSNPLWDLFTLPNMMEKCIRAGYYDAAYSLTNYGAQLEQQNLTKNPVVRMVVDVLNNARHGLLDELFNKFSGPVDLATGIQVVNNIRKIPSISPTQLRVTILQYRDMYLEKQIIAVMSEPNFLQRAIDIYRECMYETMVLYLAVFPENDFQKRFDMITDPRWEQWRPAPQSVLLQQWALRNLNRLFEHIRLTETKKAVDMNDMVSKLMTFAYSFGRMGLDFRDLVINEFDNIFKTYFSCKVEAATMTLTNDAGVIDFVETSVSSSTAPDDDTVPDVSMEINQWDALCVYGNEILSALNDLRQNLSIIQLNWCVKVLQMSFKSVLLWLDRLMNSQHNEVVMKATSLFIKVFVPFMYKNLQACFAYEKCFRNVFRSAVTKESFESHYSLLNDTLFAQCVHRDVFLEAYHSCQEVLPNEDTITRNITNEPIDLKGDGTTAAQAITTGHDEAGY